MHQPPRALHNRAQREYFESTERARILPVQSPYVMAHVQRMIAGAGLSAGQRILEVGSGLGKFTLPLVAQGYRVTANDLSPQLLARLSESTAGAEETVCCDVHEIEKHVSAPFDRIIGFFVLHHLVDFDALFATLARVLRPGGKVAFCEPVGWNPLYFVQILLTPSMRFAGEPSLADMRPSVVLPAMSRAGMVEVESRGYGYFPPFVRNRPWGGRLEGWLEARSFVPFPHAFQLFTARLPE